MRYSCVSRPWIFPSSSCSCCSSGQVIYHIKSENILHIQKTNTGIIWEEAFKFYLILIMANFLEVSNTMSIELRNPMEENQSIPKPMTIDEGCTLPGKLQVFSPNCMCLSIIQFLQSISLFYTLCVTYTCPKDPEILDLLLTTLPVSAEVLDPFQN